MLKRSFSLYTSFFCLPKRRSKKRAPGCVGPSDYLVLLAVDGTLKTLRLRRFRQVQRLIPSTAAMLSGTEWVSTVKTLENKECVFAISRSRAVPLKTGHKLRKEWISDSAEYPARGYKLRDFPMSPVLCEQRREVTLA